jgi:hypothetical protein
MKKALFFVTMLLLTIFTWGNVSAADLPTISPADGTADVWYHIRLEQRIWGIWGKSGTDESGANRAYYFDEGLGKMLRNIEDTVNIPGTRWKVVATGTADEYQLISGLGNTIDYSGTGIGDIRGERFYSVTPGAQIFTIMETDGNYLGLTLKGIGGIDKSNNDLYFDKWGPNDTGGRITFVAAEPLKPMFIQPADQNFDDVAVGAKQKKILTVLGAELSGELKYSITGDKEFTVNPLTSTSDISNGGTVEIIFTPTEQTTYTATLTISAGELSVITKLTGKSTSSFPLQISEEGGEEHWYYLQFRRRMSSNKMVQANADKSVVQATAAIGYEQLWKIVGDWNNYRLISKSSNLELKYGSDRYGLDNTGSLFGFESFQGDWELRDYGTGNQYINDNGGNYLGRYGHHDNDNGNCLVFTPASGIIPNASALAYGDIMTGLKGEKTLSVLGIQTTNPITYSLSGTGVAAFKVVNTTSGAEAASSLPAKGGTLNVVFDPNTAGKYTATLMLHSDGMTDMEIALTGTCTALPDDFPVKISDETSTTWYAVYFNRSYTEGYSWRVWTAGSAGETIKQTAQTNRDKQELTAEEQLWKFVVNPAKTGYLAVSYSGLEATAGPNKSSNDDDSYTLEEPGKGTPLLFEKNSSGAWILKNTITKIALNDQSKNTVCGYKDGADDGCPMGFIEITPILAGIIPNATALNYGDVTNGLKDVKTLTVSGRKLTNPITYTLSGTGAAAFTVVNTTSGADDANPLPAEGGTLNVVFEPNTTGEYTATLTLQSDGTDISDMEIALTGRCIPLPEDFPVKLSDETGTTWYAVYFNRSYTEGYSWRVWTAGSAGETIKQTPQSSRDNLEWATEEQLWKFVVSPEKNGYLAVSYSGLEATTGADYTLQQPDRGTPLLFAKNPSGAWILKNIAADKALNDRSENTVCEYTSDGNDDGCPVGFIEITPIPAGIIPNATTLNYGDVTTGLKDVKTLSVSGRKVKNPITYTLSGRDAAAFKVVNTTSGAEAANSLPAEGGTLNVAFEPNTTGNYTATLTLQSTDAAVPDMEIELIGNCIALPVTISDETNATWYTVYFDRSHTDRYSWKAWTAGLEGEAIKQTTQADHDNWKLAIVEQLWKFVVNPAKTGYLAVSYSGLEATAGTNKSSGEDDDYTLEEPGKGTPLLFEKNSSGAWILKNIVTKIALNDRQQNTVCGYFGGSDAGCPVGFIETAIPLDWCGDDLSWKVEENNTTLIFNGTGEMANYPDVDNVPWIEYRTSITEVIIMNDVTSIGDNAFAGCSSLTTVTFRNGDASFRSSSEEPVQSSLTNIGNRAFAECSNLSSIEIPASVTRIGREAFDNCVRLSTLDLPGSVMIIGDYAFAGCNGLTSFEIPASVTSIGEHVFYYCRNLTEVHVHEYNIKYASANGVLFNRSQTVLIKYPAAKQGETYTVPGNVARIEDQAFYGCNNLVSVEIPGSVTAVGNYAFAAAENLTSVTIGSQVQKMGYRAFSDCYALASVTNLNPTPQTVNAYTFGYVDLAGATLYVPAGSEEVYAAADIWKEFGTIRTTLTAIDTPSANTVRIYPNPVTESFRIEGLAAPAQVTISDVGGRIIFHQTVAGNEPVAVDRWPRGVYLVNVNGKTVKIIKH